MLRFWPAQLLLANCQNQLGWTPVWNARQWEGFSILLNKGVYQQAVQTRKETHAKRIRSTVQAMTGYPTEEDKKQKPRHTQPAWQWEEGEAGFNTPGGAQGTINHR